MLATNRGVSLTLNVRLLESNFKIDYSLCNSIKYLTAAAGQQAATPITGEGGELFDYIGRSVDDEETFQFLGFEFLQRLNIVQIQNDLIAARNEIFGSRCNKKKEDLKIVLNDYGKFTAVCHRTLLTIQISAIRNYNYVHQMR
jgi:hypothetical protein